MQDPSGPGIQLYSHETPPRRRAHPTPSTLSWCPQMLNQGIPGHTTGTTVGQPPELCRGLLEPTHPIQASCPPPCQGPQPWSIRTFRKKSPGPGPLRGLHSPSSPAPGGFWAHWLRTSSPAPNSYKIGWTQAGLELPATAEAGLSPVTSLGAEEGRTGPAQVGGPKSPPQLLPPCPPHPAEPLNYLSARLGQDTPT